MSDNSFPSSAKVVVIGAGIVGNCLVGHLARLAPGQARGERAPGPARPLERGHELLQAPRVDPAAGLP